MNLFERSPVNEWNYQKANLKRNVAADFQHLVSPTTIDTAEQNPLPQENLTSVPPIYITE